MVEAAATTVTNLGSLRLRWARRRQHGDDMTADSTIETEIDDEGSDVYMYILLTEQSDEVKEAKACSCVYSHLVDGPRRSPKQQLCRELLAALEYFAMFHESFHFESFVSKFSKLLQDKGLVLIAATIDDLLKSVLLLANQNATNGEPLWHRFHFDELAKLASHQSGGTGTPTSKKVHSSKIGANMSALPSAELGKRSDHGKRSVNCIFQSGSVSNHYYFGAGSINNFYMYR